MTLPPQLGTLETRTQAHRSATLPASHRLIEKRIGEKKMSRGGSSGGGRSSLSYLFEPEDTILYRTHTTAKSNHETEKSLDTNSSSVKDDNKAIGAEEVQEPPHAPPPNGEVSNPILSSHKPPCNIYHTSQLSYNNSGLLITDRPSTRVRCAPGGASSLGFLFGEEHEK